MAYPSNRQPTVSTDSVAQDQIRAFVERILRMKEEAKAINDDIREIYAEAKGNGFDKTVLGQVVAYVEKRGKDRAALMEREALFDLYMEAFDGSSSHARARAREIIEEFRPDVVVSDHVDQDGHRLRVIVDPRIAEILGRSDAEPHDPETGELIEDTEPASSEAQVRSERSGEGGEDAPALSADTQSQPGRSEAPRQIEAGLVAKVEDQSTAARSNARVMVSRRCEVCGDAFEAVPHEVKRGKARTCSMACAAKLASRPDQTGENNPNWKGGVPSSEIKRTYKDRHPEKAAAHAALTGAIRRGELVRQPCEVCGAADTEGHHDDYSKPLTVRWLCKAHHLEAHHGRFGTQAPPVDTPIRQDEPVDAVVDGTQPVSDRRDSDEIGELLDLQQQREAAQ